MCFSVHEGDGPDCFSVRESDGPDYRVVSVFMRVMALNEDFKPANWPLQIDILVGIGCSY